MPARVDEREESAKLLGSCLRTWLVSLFSGMSNASHPVGQFQAPEKCRLQGGSSLPGDENCSGVPRSLEEAAK